MSCLPAEDGSKVFFIEMAVSIPFLTILTAVTDGSQLDRLHEDPDGGGRLGATVVEDEEILDLSLLQASAFVKIALE